MTKRLVGAARVQEGSGAVLDLKPDRGRFPIVGIGASAGGLEALGKLLDALPGDSGMAFIVIQHLDPTHDSTMASLLAGRTKMTVLQPVDRMRLEGDHVYVIPPGVNLAIRDGAIRLSEMPPRRGPRRPIDIFLQSLAKECGKQAIAAILSGTGDDGSRGIQAIRENGGLVIAQDPDEAGFDGMSRNAILTGVVDLVLPVAEMAAALVKYGKQPYVRTTPADPTADDRPAVGLNEIIDLLRRKTAHDFTLYKPGTLSRRIERRIAILGVQDGESYLTLLRADPAAIDVLAKDMLIHATRFFRDPKAFETLEEKVIPELVRRHPEDRTLRVWVPACSSGEEAYSIAMLFIEAIAAAKRDVKLQIFASDVDEDALGTARAGIYPESIEADVAPARLARFFAKKGRSYRVVRELRQVVVFTVQNLLAHAPFSRLDFVSCRNLLIYLLPEVQERVISLFHFALREDGILLLGDAETVGRLGTHFAPISKRQRIYRHAGHGQPIEVAAAVGAIDVRPMPSLRTAEPPASLGDLAAQLLAQAYVPASVLVNYKHECLSVFGATDRYLQLTAGGPNRDVIAMAHEGLGAKLESALQRAAADRAPATVVAAKMIRDGGGFAVGICVRPTEIEGQELMLVSFVDEPKPKRPRRAGPTKAASARKAALEQDLDATRKELGGAIRDLEIAHEDHQAINEEAMTVNEEYQSSNQELKNSKEELRSSNEELEISKEELQTLNEELTTLNQQLQETLAQQRDTTNDLRNVMYSSDVATLFLDTDLNIRLFTPATTSLFRLIASDIGRPFKDFTPHFVDGKILTDASDVLANLAPVGCEVRTASAVYLRRILPYRTVEGTVDGVVITFADISEMKAAEAEIVAARAQADSIISSIRQPLVVLDDELRVVAAGRSFYDAFNATAEDTLGVRLWKNDDHQLDVPALHDFLRKTRSDAGAVDNCEIEIDVPPRGRRRLLLEACDIRAEPGAARQILLSIDDITERKQAEAALKAAKADAERANLAKSKFLAAASHDLRQPLQTISLMQGVLQKRVTDEAALQLIGKLGDTVGAMSGMLNTLLDINQLEAGIVFPEMVDFPINELLEGLKAEFAYHTGGKGLGWRVVPCHMRVRSDRNLFEQMVRNLLSNAVKYTERGRILVGCHPRGNKLRLEVWDTGIGIPADQLQAIFQEFHQLNNPARERSLGLGLGLSLVQRLGDLLGVTIDVRSRPGSGSVFAVEVPLAAGAREAWQADGRRRGADKAVTGGSLLIIEDDPMLLDLLALLFQDEGHQVAVAQDGRQALALASTGGVRPDVIVADYNLPGGMNGLQIIEGLREMLQRDIPAVIMTGDISTGTSLSIAPTNCIQLNKPVKSDDLTSLIQRLLAVPDPPAPGEQMPAAAA
jgi:two-component system CheB/CheR fusion protein